MFFRAATRAASCDWASVYELSEAERYPFLYPPATLALLLPLSELSAAAAYFAVSLTMLAAFGAALALLRRLGERGGRLDSATSALLIVGSAAAGASVAIGQLSPLFLLVLVGALVAMRSGREVLAGLLLSVLALEPTLGLFLPLGFGLLRRARLVGSLLAATALWYGLSWAIDPDAFEDWTRALGSMAPALDAGSVHLARNHTLWAALNGLARDAPRAIRVTAWSALVIPPATLLGRWTWRAKGAESLAREAATWTLLVVAETPQPWATWQMLPTLQTSRTASAFCSSVNLRRSLRDMWTSSPIGTDLGCPLKRGKVRQRREGSGTARARQPALERRPLMQAPARVLEP